MHKSWHAFSSMANELAKYLSDQDFCGNKKVGLHWETFPSLRGLENWCTLWYMGALELRVMSSRRELWTSTWGWNTKMIVHQSCLQGFSCSGFCTCGICCQCKQNSQCCCLINWMTSDKSPEQLQTGLSASSRRRRIQTCVDTECESSGMGKGDGGWKCGAAQSTRTKSGCVKVCYVLGKHGPMGGMFVHRWKAQIFVGRVCTCELCGCCL